jgi:hypothetical protein
MGESTIFLINDVEKTYPYGKEKSWTLTLHTTINPRGIEDLKV